MRKVDIVIPVYDGLEETRSCLHSVLASCPYDWARVVVVNDCSPDPRISAYLRELAGREASMELLENERNLGFVATANRGMQFDEERDILLLNSDVEVAGDWLHRLRLAAYSEDRIGSLTPFSNNATICSFPNFCKDNDPLFGLGVEELDRTFSQLFGPTDRFEVPTGVGFCMYIRRDCLQQVGYFDEDTFGRGYGEENDWCQRVMRAGWGNYHQANCFVYHKGGVSFAEEQNPRIERALQLLDQRYPSYHADVQAFIASDPGRFARTRALLQLFAGQVRPKIAFVSHKLGGGAQQHVNELAALYGKQALFLQITPDTDGQSVTLSVFGSGERLQDGLYFDVEQEYDKLLQLLQQLGTSRLHFHHTMGLHPRLWRLASDLGCDYDLTIHDYYLVNGNPTLTDSEAYFVSDDAADFDSRCAGHYPLPEGITADTWRDNQRLLVEGASRVIFPSLDCRQRFCLYFELRQAVVAWHPDYRLSRPYPAPEWGYAGGRPLKVLVLGAISREKGADLLERVAHSLAGQAVEFHLLGYAYRPLDPVVQTHGPYGNDAVYELVQGIDPDVLWYPALWPETYSYTLSVGLHLGLPVVVPDIGAFGERVAGRPCSAVRPWDSSDAQWADFWRGLAQGGAIAAGPVGPAGATLDDAAAGDYDFYAADYLADIPASVGQLSPATLDGLERNLHVGLPQLTGSEKLLGQIWSLSRRPVVAKMLSMVPFGLQRAIKRKFSSRPMHDIVRGE